MESEEDTPELLSKVFAMVEPFDGCNMKPDTKRAYTYLWGRAMSNDHWILWTLRTLWTPFENNQSENIILSSGIWPLGQRAALLYNSSVFSTFQK